MNYVNEQNMQEILDGIARKIGQGGGTGSGLEDWQSEHTYSEKDICVYEGQIYRAKVGFTSDTTFSTIQILEEYTPVGGETIIPYEQDTEISIDDIVSYDNNTYKALYNFVCGEEFSLYALEEYVPKELTEVQEAEIINHFLPNIYSGGNMSVEDSTPIGTIISFMGTIAPENYLVCDGTIYNIADYIELAEFIKTQFGSYNYFGGDGVTTFAVPDLQGEFLRMTGTNSHTNQGSGANVGVHQDGTTFGNTSEIVSGSTTNLRVTTPNETQELLNVDSAVEYSSTGGTFNTFTPSSTESYSGEIAKIVTSRPTNTSVLYCIKYQMSITNAEEIKDLTTEDIKQIVSAYNPVFEEAKGIEYSTEERRIGTWIDGKPLYQKTYTGTTPDTAETATELFILPNNVNTTNVFYMNMSVYNVDGHVCFPNYLYLNESESVICWIRNNKYVTCIVKATKWLNANYVITLQYTKTTD